MRCMDWMATAAAVTLLVVGCQPSGPDPAAQPPARIEVPAPAGPPAAPPSAESPAPAPDEASAPAPPTAEAPGEQAGPADAAGEPSGTRALRAVGGALLKSVGRGEEPEPDEAPPFRP